MDGHSVSRSPRTARQALAGALAIAALAPASAAAAPVGEITRFTEGIAGRPVDLTAGPDRNLWFTDPAFDRSGIAPTVGRITPRGAITRFDIGLRPVRVDETYPRHISPGPDARLWFTLEGAAPGIGRIGLGGGTTFFRQGLGPDAQLGPIVRGSDGNLWLSDDGPTPAIVRVTPAGSITEFAVPEPARSLTAGPDGNLWFTMSEGQPAIGRITPSGTITTFDPGAGSRPSVIVAGADDNLWFTDIGGSFLFENPRIGRITPSGTIMMFSGLLPASRPGDMALGPEGNVWFTDFASVYTGGRPKIGRITPAGEISQFFSNCLRNTPGDGPTEIIAGPDGNVWFSHDTRRSLPAIGPVPSIARVAPDGTITEFTAGIRDVPHDVTVGPDGRIWFIDPGFLPAIARVTPPSTPPNVFSVSGWALDRDRGTALLRLDLPPGRGPMQLWGPEVVPRALEVGGCRAEVRVAAKGRARRTLTRTGRVDVRARVTFTPAGGEPFTKVIRIPLRKPVP